jgi:hypothetical protein
MADPIMDPTTSDNAVLKPSVRGSCCCDIKCVLGSIR